MTLICTAAKNKDAAEPLNHIITPLQMLENDYPLPSYLKGLESGPSTSTDEQWDESPRPSDDEGSGKPDVIAIDCEMVSVNFRVLSSR